MYLESTEQATTSVWRAWNSSRRSLKARISVGHTNVLLREAGREGGRKGGREEGWEGERVGGGREGGRERNEARRKRWREKISETEEIGDKRSKCYVAFFSNSQVQRVKEKDQVLPWRGKHTLSHSSKCSHT